MGVPLCVVIVSLTVTISDMEFTVTTNICSVCIIRIVCDIHQKV